MTTERKAKWQEWAREHGASCAGARSDSDDYALEWCVFARRDIDVWCAENGYDLLKGEDHAYIISDLVGWYRYDGGAGRWFSHTPYMQVGRNHVLIKRSCGLDI